jgi:hypothetical protein
MDTTITFNLHKSDRRDSRAKCRDFYLRYDVLLANWYLLTSRIQEEILSIRQDLHEDLARWRPHHPEPDWEAYADRVKRLNAKVAVH